MQVSRRDLRLLIDGTKPIATNDQRAEAYWRIRTAYETECGHQLVPTQSPIPGNTYGSTERNLAPLNPVSDWDDPNKDPAWTEITLVIGGTGFSASAPAGTVAALIDTHRRIEPTTFTDHLRLAKVVTTSGGLIASVPGLIGMPPHVMRAMNAGVDSAALVPKVDTLSPKRFFTFAGKRTTAPIGDLARAVVRGISRHNLWRFSFSRRSSASRTWTHKRCSR